MLIKQTVPKLVAQDASTPAKTRSATAHNASAVALSLPLDGWNQLNATAAHNAHAVALSLPLDGWNQLNLEDSPLQLNPPNGRWPLFKAEAHPASTVGGLYKWRCLRPLPLSSHGSSERDISALNMNH